MDEDKLSCAVKMAFDNQKQAQAIATTLSAERGVKLKTYQCRQCQLWHLTSN